MDKSGALRARQLAKRLVRKGVDEARVTLGWSPGAARHLLIGRHPIYTGVMFVSLGWALVWQSWPALLTASGAAYLSGANVRACSASRLWRLIDDQIPLSPSSRSPEKARSRSELINKSVWQHLPRTCESFEKSSGRLKQKWPFLPVALGTRSP